MANEELDMAKVGEFAGTMVGIINSGALTLMTSIGHETGLFDMMAGLPPSTSEEIAKAASLNERYVREWLGAMVTGRIVEYDPATKTYLFPAVHAACLTRAAGENNLATFAQFIPLFALVNDQIVESFRKGGGVPYSAYPTFQKLTAQLTAQIFDATLLNSTLTLVPGLTERLKAGIDVADVG